MLLKAKEATIMELSVTVKIFQESERDQKQLISILCLEVVNKVEMNAAQKKLYNN